MQKTAGVGTMCPPPLVIGLRGVSFLEFCSRMFPFARKMKFPWNFLLKAKFDKNSPFWSEGCILGQNSRKLTPLKIPFYCQGNITLPNNTFIIAWQWHQFDFGVIFTLFCFLNWLFAAKFSNCSNSLNFEAKINCNTSKPNVPKWRKTCTGLKFD